MRQNTKKFKPYPTKTSRHNIRSSSIRDIIGDRRFNHQFSHVNPHGTEGIKKVKRTKVDDAESETDDLPNLGQNASSSQNEAVEDPNRSSAKTSEYAFFKKLKQTTSTNIHVHPKHHDNQVNSVEQIDHSTKEDIPNVQKKCIKHSKSSSPIEKQQDDDSHYSFLSPPIYGSKNVVKFTPCVYNRISPTIGSNTTTSGNEGVFSVKREKLSRRVADTLSYDVNQLSSKGFDLISALMDRILPNNQDKNCKDETSIKYKQPKGQEAKKRKLMESRHVKDDDDDFPRSLERHLEWNPNGLESCFEYDHYDSEAYKRKFIESQHISYPRSSERLTDIDYLEWNPHHSDSSKSSSQYDRCYSDTYKRKWIKPHHISYLDNDLDLPRSSERFTVTDMNLLEWNPNHSDSSISCFRYDYHHSDSSKSICEYDDHYHHSEAYKRKWMDSSHISKLEDCIRFPRRLEWNPTEDGIRIPKLDIDRYEEKYHFDNESKLLQKPLLLGWEEKNNEKDEFEKKINTFLTSQDDDYYHQYKKDNFDFESSSKTMIPYKYTTPKHVMQVEEEDCNINNNTWFLNECDLNEKQDFFKGDDRVKSYSYMEGIDGEYYGEIGYPLMLLDSSENEYIV